MRDYGTADYGIALTEEEVCFVARKYTEEKYPEEFEDWFGGVDPEDDNLCECEDIADNIVCSISDFSGAAWKIEKDGSASERLYDEYEGQSVYYIPLLQYSNLFHPAFDSYEDMVNQHKEEYAKYLPDDFPWEERFVRIAGCYWG